MYDSFMMIHEIGMWGVYKTLAMNHKLVVIPFGHLRIFSENGHFIHQFHVNSRGCRWHGMVYTHWKSSPS